MKIFVKIRAFLGYFPEETYSFKRFLEIRKDRRGLTLISF